MQEVVWLYGSSMVLQVDRLRNSLAPGFLNSATVLATVRDASTELPILGATWPAMLTYVLNSDGRYRVTVDYDVDVIDGQWLLVDYTVLSGALQRQWRKRVPVVRVD